MRDWVGYFYSYFDSSNYRLAKFSELRNAGFNIIYQKKLWLISCQRFSVVLDYNNAQRFFFSTRYDALNYLAML